MRRLQNNKPFVPYHRTTTDSYYEKIQGKKWKQEMISLDLQEKKEFILFFFFLNPIMGDPSSQFVLLRHLSLHYCRLWILENRSESNASGKMI